MITQEWLVVPGDNLELDPGFILVFKMFFVMGEEKHEITNVARSISVNESCLKEFLFTFPGPGKLAYKIIVFVWLNCSFTEPVLSGTKKRNKKL